MIEIITQLFDFIRLHQSIHAKYLDQVVLSFDEQKDFESLILYYQDKLQVSLREQAEYYLMFLQKNLEETKFFLENNHYRYTTFAEVKDKVYFNAEYMRKYMIGLSLSSYIWNTHIDARKFFVDYLMTRKKTPHASYLEVGPGHGEYFLKAVKSKVFDTYMGIDISPTSCKMSKEMIESYDEAIQADFLCGDFLSFDTTQQYDLIVMGEVLEHVESPLLFLKKAHHLLRDKESSGGGGHIFVTIPINAPDIDHIFLFSHPDEVLDMIRQAHLKIKSQMCYVANQYPIAKALKRRFPILMVAILEQE